MSVGLHDWKIKTLCYVIIHNKDADVTYYVYVVCINIIIAIITEYQ